MKIGEHEIFENKILNRIEEYKFEGSSIDQKIIRDVYKIAENKKRVIVVLDSNHTHEHVLEELRAYAPLVSINSYCVVSDTGIEDLENDLILDRPWGKGNSPKSAIWEYLEVSDNFEIDKYYETKILVTASPDGFLKRIK